QQNQYQALGAPPDFGEQGGVAGFGFALLWSAAVSAALVYLVRFFPRQEKKKAKAAETAALQSPPHSPKSRGAPPSVQPGQGGGKTIRYEGVLLAEVLRFGGVPFGKHPRGERTAEFVLVEAVDGYRTVLALAEVDPALTDHVVLLADRLDGKPLTESSGPYRLV